MEGGGGKCTFEYVEDMRFSNVLRKLTRMFISPIRFPNFKLLRIYRNRVPKLKCANFSSYRKFYLMALMSLYWKARWRNVIKLILIPHDHSTFKDSLLSGIKHRAAALSTFPKFCHSSK